MGSLGSAGQQLLPMSLLLTPCPGEHQAPRVCPQDNSVRGQAGRQHGPLSTLPAHFSKKGGSSASVAVFKDFLFHVLFSLNWHFSSQFLEREHKSMQTSSGRSSPGTVCVKNCSAESEQDVSRAAPKALGLQAQAGFGLFGCSWCCWHRAGSAAVPRERSESGRCWPRISSGHGAAVALWASVALGVILPWIAS